MAEWWEEFTAQPAAQPAASGGNWWDAYTADFGNVESGSVTAPRPLMASAQDDPGILSHLGGLWDRNAGALVEAAGGLVQAAGELPRDAINYLQDAGSAFGAIANPGSPYGPTAVADTAVADIESRHALLESDPNALTRVGRDISATGSGQSFVGQRDSAVRRPESVIGEPLQAVKYYANEAAGSAIPLAIAVAAPEVGLPLFGAQAFGGEYDKRRAEGVSPLESAGSGAIHAAAEVIPESAALKILTGKVGSVVKDMVGKRVADAIERNALARAAAGGLAEGGSEVVTQLAQDASDIGMGDDISLEQMGSRAKDAFLTGAAMGAPAGGLTATVQNLSDRSGLAQRQASALTGQLERSANRIRTPESDAVEAGREAVRAMHAAVGDSARPDPATIDFTQPVFENREAAIQAEQNTTVPIPERISPDFIPERKTEKTIPQNRLAELEAKPEPTLFEREEIALLQEGKPFDRQALLADLESAPEPELIRNGTRVFYPGDVKAMRAKLAEAGLSEGMRMTGEDGSDAGLYFPARLRAEVDAVLRPKPAEQAQPEPVKEGELPYRELGIKPPQKPRNRVKSAADFDPNYHDIRDFIALHGGLDAKAFAAEFNSEVPSPAENFRFFGKPLFRKSGGLQPDQLRELLQETGFLNPDSMDGVARYTPQDAYDLVERALDGSPVYHPSGVDTQNAIQNYRNYNTELEQRQEYIDDQGVTPELDEEFARRSEALDRGDLEPVYSKRAKDRTATPDMFGATQRAQSAPTPRPASGDLFGAPTSRDRLDAAQRDSDARLTGPAVGMRQGDGELFAGKRPEQKVLRSQRPDTQGIEVDEATDLTPEELAAFNRQVDTGRGQRETSSNDRRTSPSNADARRDGARRTVEDQGGRSGQPVPVQDSTFAPDAPADVSGKPPKFPRWFRQSKLKNPKGIPLEFNHTTNADFDTFDSSRRGSNTGYAPSGLGNWFSQSVEGYGSKKLTGNIRMENPKVMPLHKLPDLDTQEDFAAYADKLRDQGFDGIYFPDVKQAVTFDSVQFKENDNTEYSESPNIYRSQRTADPRAYTEKHYGKVPEVTRLPASLLTARDMYETDGVERSIKASGLSRENWAATVNLSEPVEATIYSDGEIKLQDGHHRVTAANILGRDVNVDLSAINAKAEVLNDLISQYATSPSILKSEGKKSAPNRLSDADVAKAKADAESRVAAHWGRSAVNKLKTRGRVEFITKQEVVDRGLQTMAELDGVDGFFDPESGKAYVIADSGAQSADLPGVLSHEVFHANAEQFLGTDGFKRLKEAFRKLKSRDKDIAAAYKRVPSDTKAAHVDEEGIAYLAQEAPKHRLSERLTDEAKLFLNRLGIPLDWLNAHAAAVRKIAALNLRDAGNRGRVARFDKDGVKYQKGSRNVAEDGEERRSSDGSRRLPRASDMPASPDESLPDDARSAIKQLSKTLVSDTGVVKPFGSLDVVDQRMVLSEVRGLIQDGKVLNSVVRSIPVDVVNMLGGKKISSKDLLHDPSVLVDLLPKNANDLVASNIPAMNVLAQAVTLSAAKVQSGLSGLDVSPSDFLTASGALRHDVSPVVASKIQKAMAGVNKAQITPYYSKRTRQDAEKDAEPTPRFNSATEFWTDNIGKPLFNTISRATKAVIANDFLKRHGLNLAEDMPPEAQKAWRAYKQDVGNLKKTVSEIADEAKNLSPEERAMVSDLVEREMKAGVTPPEAVVRMATLMTSIMRKQSQQLVETGMLSKDAADRWEGRYLPRFYQKHLLTNPFDAMLRKAYLSGIKGTHLKGRGLFETVPVEDVPAYEKMGWEVRDPEHGKKPGLKGLPEGAKVRVWRDFTPAERQKMGEVRDAMYRFARGYTDTQIDIAKGKLFDHIARTVARDDNPGGSYVLVPDTSVPGTGVKKFGNLAGKYVPGDVLAALKTKAGPDSDITSAYLKALSLWKEGKTSLNPVTHVNNVVSNLVMADLAGVNLVDPRSWKLYADTFNDYRKEGAWFKEAQKAGLFGGEWYGNEVAQWLPLPSELKDSGPRSIPGKFAMKTANALGSVRRGMGNLYRAEDQFFKLLLYKQARERGLDPNDAVTWAEKFVFDYSTAAPGVTKLKNSLFPFANYSSKAVPALTFAATHYPWRIAKWIGLLSGFSLYAFNTLYGDDEAEEMAVSEAAMLPDYLKGRSSFFGVPKAIRLPYDDESTGDGMYVDISRFVPLGDLFDAENQSGGVPLPAPLTPNNPIITTAIAMLANKDSFTGKDIVRESDTGGEAAQKRIGWLYRQMAPNNPLVPGSYNFNRIGEAASAVAGEPIGPYTGLDYNGNTISPGRALAQTFGIKLRSVDFEKEMDFQIYDLKREISDLKGQKTKLKKNQSISDETLESELDKLDVKIEAVRDRLANLQDIPIPQR